MSPYLWLGTADGQRWLIADPAEADSLEEHPLVTVTIVSWGDS